MPQRRKPEHATITLLETQSENQTPELSINTK